jgi:hypothetical protein
VRGDAVRPVEYPGSGEERDRLGAGPVGVAVAGAATSGFSATIRARPLPSTGITLYLPASTYQVPSIAISRSRCSAATLWFSAKSSTTW